MIERTVPRVYGAGFESMVFECTGFEGARSLARDIADKKGVAVPVWWRREPVKGEDRQKANGDYWRHSHDVEPTLTVLERCR